MSSKGLKINENKLYLSNDGVEGLLVPPRDAQALARACLRLGDDAALRAAMGARARQRAVELFDVRIVNAVIMEALGA